MCSIPTISFLSGSLTVNCNHHRTLNCPSGDCTVRFCRFHCSNSKKGSL